LETGKVLILRLNFLRRREMQTAFALEKPFQPPQFSKKQEDATHRTPLQFALFTSRGE
jgi:hypothetical protein